jgi:hypothetical protein
MSRSRVPFSAGALDDFRVSSTTYEVKASARGAAQIGYSAPAEKFSLTFCASEDKMSRIAPDGETDAFSIR